MDNIKVSEVDMKKPGAFLATFMEISRRSVYSEEEKINIQVFNSTVKQFAENMSKIKLEEQKRRDKFLKEFQSYLPNDLILGKHQFIKRTCQ